MDGSLNIRKRATITYKIICLAILLGIFIYSPSAFSVDMDAGGTANFTLRVNNIGEKETSQFNGSVGFVDGQWYYYDENNNKVPISGGNIINQQSGNQNFTISSINGNDFVEEIFIVTAPDQPDPEHPKVLYGDVEFNFS